MISSGFLVYLISIYFMMVGNGTTLYAIGGWIFWAGVGITIIGIIKNNGSSR